MQILYGEFVPFLAPQLKQVGNSSFFPESGTLVFLTAKQESFPENVAAKGECYH